MNVEENERQYRVIDQMLTAHSTLRDRYQRLATALSIFLLTVAIVLNAFVFTADDVLASLGFKPAWAKNGLAVAAVIALILSIVEWRVDWSGRSSLHKQAVQRLGLLKLSYRAVYDKVQAGDRSEADRLTKEYEQTMPGLTPIPEASLISLYAKHRYKCLLNDLAREHPTCPVWILRLKLRIGGVQRVFTERSKRDRRVQRSGL